VLITVVGHMEQAMKIFYEVVSSITWKRYNGKFKLGLNQKRKLLQLIAVRTCAVPVLLA
jgi:hypothetical protein